MGRHVSLGRPVSGSRCLRLRRAQPIQKVGLDRRQAERPEGVRLLRSSNRRSSYCRRSCRRHRRDLFGRCRQVGSRRFLERHRRPQGRRPLPAGRVVSRRGSCGGRSRPTCSSPFSSAVEYSTRSLASSLKRGSVMGGLSVAGGRLSVAKRLVGCQSLVVSCQLFVVSCSRD